MSDDDCSYIHGKAGENNIVLGFEEYLDDDKKDKNWHVSALKNIFKEYIRKLVVLIRSGFPKRKKNIYIFGHSLAVSRKDVLKEFILNKKVKTTIYYYSEEAYAQQIINLVEIIGQDVLIEKVYGKKSTNYI